MADDLWDLSALEDNDPPPSLARARDRLGMKMMANKQLFGSVLQSEHNVADRFKPAASGQNLQALSASQDGRQTSPVYNRPYGTSSRPVASRGEGSGPVSTDGNPIQQMQQYLNVLGLHTPPGSGPGGITQKGRPVVGILKKPAGILKKPSSSASSSQSSAPADGTSHQSLPSRPVAESSLQQASLSGRQNHPSAAGQPQPSQASLTDSLPIASSAGRGSAQSSRSLISSHPQHSSTVSVDRRQALVDALQLQRFSLTDSLPIKPLEAVPPRQRSFASMSEKDVLSLTNALPLYSSRDQLVRSSSDHQSSTPFETDTPPASGKAGQDRSEEGKHRKSRTRSHHSPRKSSGRRRGVGTEDPPLVQYPASVVPRPQRSETAPRTAATAPASDVAKLVIGDTSSSKMITYKYGVARSAKPASATPLSVGEGTSQRLPPAASSSMMLAAAAASKLTAKLAHPKMVASATLPASAPLVSTSLRGRKSRSISPGSNELWSRSRDESPQRSQSRSVKKRERSRDSRSSSRTVTIGDPAKSSGSYARNRTEKSRSRSRGRSNKSRSSSRGRQRRSKSRSKDRRRKHRSRSRDRKRKSRSRSRDSKRKSRSRSKDRRRKYRSRSRDRNRKSRSRSRYSKRKSRSRSRDRMRKSKSHSRDRSRNSRSYSRDRKRKSRSPSRDLRRKSRSPSRARSRDHSRKSTSLSRASGRKSRSRSWSQRRLLGARAQRSPSGPRSLAIRRSRSRERSRRESHSQDRSRKRSRSTDKIHWPQNRTQQISRSRSRTPKRIRYSRSPIASYRRGSELLIARRSISPTSGRLAPGGPWRATAYDGRALPPMVRGLDRPGWERFRGEVMDSRLGYGSIGVPVFPPGSYPFDRLGARHYPSDLIGPHLAGPHEEIEPYFPRVRERIVPHFPDARDSIDFSVARERSPHTMLRTAIAAGRARSPDRSSARFPGDREPSPHSLFRAALAAGSERARREGVYGEAPEPVPVTASGYAEAYYPRRMGPFMETTMPPSFRDGIRGKYPKRSTSPDERRRQHDVSPSGSIDERLLCDRFPSASPERRSNSPRDKSDEAHLSAQRSSTERRSRDRSHERRARSDKDTKEHANSERKRSASEQSERSDSRRSGSRLESETGRVSKADDEVKGEKKVVGKEVSARKERDVSPKKDAENLPRERKDDSGRSSRKDKESSTASKDTGKSSDEKNKIESSKKTNTDVHKSSKTIANRQSERSESRRSDSRPESETGRVSKGDDEAKSDKKVAGKEVSARKERNVSLKKDAENLPRERRDDGGRSSRKDKESSTVSEDTGKSSDEKKKIESSKMTDTDVQKSSKTMDSANDIDRSLMEENDTETTSKGILPVGEISTCVDNRPETNASSIGSAGNSSTPEGPNKEAEKGDRASLSVSNAGFTPTSAIAVSHSPGDKTSKPEGNLANSEREMTTGDAQQTAVPENEGEGSESCEEKLTGSTDSERADGGHQPDATERTERGGQDGSEIAQGVASTHFVGPKSAERGAIKCSVSESESLDKEPETGAGSGASAFKPPGSPSHRTTEATESEPRRVDSGNLVPQAVSVEANEPDTKDETEINVSDVKLAVAKGDENTTDRNAKTSPIREIRETSAEITTNKSPEGNAVKLVSDSALSNNVSKATTSSEDGESETSSGQAVATKVNLEAGESETIDKMDKSDSRAGPDADLGKDPTDQLALKPGEVVKLNPVDVETESSNELPQTAEPKSVEAIAAKASEAGSMELIKPVSAGPSTSEASKKLDVSVHGIEEVDVADLDAAPPGEVIACSTRSRQRDRSGRRRKSKDRDSRTRSRRERGRSRDKSRESSPKMSMDALLAGGFQVVDATSDMEDEDGVDSIEERALDQGELRSRGLSLWDARNERDANKRRRSGSPRPGKETQTKCLYTVRDGRIVPLEKSGKAEETAKSTNTEKQPACGGNDGSKAPQLEVLKRPTKKKRLPGDTVFYRCKGSEMIELSDTQKRWLLLYGPYRGRTPEFFRKIPGDAERFEMVHKYLMMGVLKRQYSGINIVNSKEKTNDRFGERSDRSSEKEKPKKVIAAGSLESQKSGSQSPKRSSCYSHSPKRTVRRSSSPKTRSRHRYSPERTGRDISSNTKSRFSRSPKRRVRDTSSPRSRVGGSPSPKRIASGTFSSRAASRDSCSPQRGARDKSPKTRSRGSPSPKRIGRGSSAISRGSPSPKRIGRELSSRDAGLEEVQLRRGRDHPSPESMKWNSGQSYESPRLGDGESDMSPERGCDWEEDEYPSLPVLDNHSYRHIITIQCAEIDWSKAPDLQAGDTKSETAPPENTADAEIIPPESKTEQADSADCSATLSATVCASESVAPRDSFEAISDEDNNDLLCNDREDKTHPEIMPQGKQVRTGNEEATGSSTVASTSAAGDQREAVIPEFAPLVTETISDGEDQYCFESEDCKKVEIPDNPHSETRMETENTSSEAVGVSSRQGENSDAIKVEKLNAGGELKAVGEAASTRETKETLLKSWKLEDGDWKEVWTVDNSIKKNSIKLNLISKLDDQPDSSKLGNPACEEASAGIQEDEKVPQTVTQTAHAPPTDGNSTKKVADPPARKEVSVKITFRKKPVKPKRKETVHEKPKASMVMSPGESRESPAMARADAAGYSEGKGNVTDSTGNQLAATSPAEENKAPVGSGVEEPGSRDPRNQTVLQVCHPPTEASPVETVAEESGTCKQEIALVMSKNPMVKEGTEVETPCREQQKTVIRAVKLGGGDAKLNQEARVVLERIGDVLETQTDVKLGGGGVLPKRCWIPATPEIITQGRSAKKTEDRSENAEFVDAKLKQATVVELENIEGMLETLESMEEAGAAGNDGESRTREDELPHGSPGGIA